MFESKSKCILAIADSDSDFDDSNLNLYMRLFCAWRKKYIQPMLNLEVIAILIQLDLLAGELK